MFLRLQARGSRRRRGYVSALRTAPRKTDTFRPC